MSPLVPADISAGLHVVSVPLPTADGAPKEVVVLVDLAAVKVVAITLRAGAALAEHAASLPVTIQAAHGRAIVSVRGTAADLAPGAFVVLDANTPHAVAPVGEEPVTVLVHHHR